ncbi:MAG: hypothetical protein ACOYT8_01435 [Candidatus Dependentiae bacterium]
MKKQLMLLFGLIGCLSAELTYAAPVGVYFGFGGTPYYNYYPYYYNYPSWYAYNYPYYYGVPYKGFYPTRYARCKYKCPRRNRCVRSCR